jgi:hypothetical protein
VCCSGRSFTAFACARRLRADRDQLLLAHLCDLARRLDPMPEHVPAAARSAGCVPYPNPNNSGRHPVVSEHSSSITEGQDQVQNPLTLVMPIKSEQDAQALGAALDSEDVRNRIEVALHELRTVHFARFVLLDGEPRRLAVITSYDDGFEDYIMSFTDELGEIFDTLLEFVHEPPPRPVKQHREEFLDYVREHDLRSVGTFFSAYPQRRVVDIAPVPSPTG